MSDESSPEDIRAGFAEACNLARHYSTLRFVMFSVFITIIGALVAVEFDSTRRPVGKPLDLFRVGSFCLVMSFMVSEWRIGQLVKFYQKATYEFGARNGRTSLAVAMPPATAFWRIFAPVLTITPFGLAALLWVIALIYFRGSPLWSTPIQH